jgi:hypothetical protein
MRVGQRLLPWAAAIPALSRRFTAPPQKARIDDPVHLTQRHTSDRCRLICGHEHRLNCGHLNFPNPSSHMETCNPQALILPALSIVLSGCHARRPRAMHVFINHSVFGANRLMDEHACGFAPGRNSSALGATYQRCCQAPSQTDSHFRRDGAASGNKIVKLLSRDAVVFRRCADRHAGLLQGCRRSIRPGGAGSSSP